VRIHLLNGWGDLSGGGGEGILNFWVGFGWERRGGDFKILNHLQNA
jgi:hypothetical protein